MTIKKSQKITFLDLIKNEKFLKWRFFRDIESEIYWNKLIKKNPTIEKEIIKADEYLKKHFFKSHSFNLEDKENLLKKIERELKSKDLKDKKQRIWIKYAAVASIILLIGIGTLRIYQKKFPSNDVISASILNTKDIQLIVNNKPKSFSENITVKVKSSGITEIKEEGDLKNKIDIKVDNDNYINKLIIPYGKHSKIVLSDGTKVWLNAGSTLEFPSVFKSNKREIKLSGEMYIEVAPNMNKPFIVLTDNLNVHVLGTKFNITVYENSTQSVSLFEGHVELISDSYKITDIYPNEQVNLAKSGKITKETIENIEDMKAWIDGYLIFRKTPISEVLNQIERYYNLSFNYDESINLHKRNCTGKIYLSLNLDQVMETIALLSSTEYKKIDNKVYLINKSKK